MTAQPTSPKPPPAKPRRPPREYLRGTWPDSPVRRVPEEEGGEAVEHLVEQAARLARQISSRRLSRGLSRSRVAALTGLRPNTVLDVEEGRSWPDLRTLGLLAWALEADLELEPRVPLRARDRWSRT
ncbi:MAG TPA: helix-turn-helix transcriptional regulator [Egibacteraceae bacterium]|nr:helix-turn-helix transcriptional regulator [Egibacteraceae bacterium]